MDISNGFSLFVFVSPCNIAPRLAVLRAGSIVTLGLTGSNVAVTSAASCQKLFMCAMSVPASPRTTLSFSISINFRIVPGITVSE